MTAKRRSEFLDPDGEAYIKAGLAGDDGPEGEENLLVESIRDEGLFKTHELQSILKKEYWPSNATEEVLADFREWLEDEGLGPQKGKDNFEWWDEYIYDMYGEAAFIFGENDEWLLDYYAVKYDGTVLTDDHEGDEGEVTVLKPSNQQFQSQQSYQSHSQCKGGAHDGTNLDVAFAIGDVTFAGSKAFDVKGTPDIVLDFSDTTSTSSIASPNFITSGPDEFKALEQYVTHTVPPVLVKFRWPDGGVPPVGAEFWRQLWMQIGETLVKRNGRCTGRVVPCCTGGHGRTGTALSSFLIVVGGLTAAEAVHVIRSDYCNRAVETAGQINYLAALDAEVSEILSDKQRAAAKSSITRPNKDRIPELAAKEAKGPSASPSASKTQPSAVQSAKTIASKVWTEGHGWYE